jgi:hypothetical protein
VSKILSFGSLGFVLVACQCGGTVASPSGGPDAATEGSSGSDAGSGGDASGGNEGGGNCGASCTGPLRLCCGTCVNPDNDPHNCGGCGIQCAGSTPYCDGTCKPAPCAQAKSCMPPSSCCDTMCCGTGQLCCKNEGPIGGPPSCVMPDPQTNTCPVGCAPLCKSDKDSKRDVVPVDGRQVLASLVQVPMSTWSYKTDDAEVRHLGPMAQDFHAAFGLGDTDRAYDPIDAHGVAFAAIQGLYTMIEEQNARIERLEEENARLRACNVERR